MSSPTLDLSEVRRLAIRNQGLSARRFGSLAETFEALNCVQVDPINVVARTQHLVLHSRLGTSYSPDDLHRFAYEDKRAFHYWAHAASLVRTEDLPIHRSRMRRWPGDGPWGDRIRAWMKDNASFRRYILRRLDADGPLRARDLEDRTVQPWASTGWTHGQNVGRMLEFMWTKGEITVAGRMGLDRIWDRTDRWFPDWAPRTGWTDRRVTEE
ncbi:MAG: DNA glycosylase AlkZ-like family protein, partial [Actinomycetota bacterium]